MATAEQRLANVQAFLDFDEDLPVGPPNNFKPAPAPDVETAVARALGDEFGWHYDPVLNPETTLEIAELVVRVIREWDEAHPE